MASCKFLLASLLLISGLIEISYGNTLFSSLQNSLVVTASHKGGVLKAGEDKITVTWGFNKSYTSGADADYKTIKVKLCYAPVSQENRAWRKTKDILSKDKTCQFKIVAKPYSSASETAEWMIERDTPTATYFVRAYAYNAEESEVAYGQTTDAKKTTNLFEIKSISGRPMSLDIASVCFSVFAILALIAFFSAEKMKAKRESKK
ncbi:hypothetical protein ACFE04_027198 [Oxalis oulophora]